MAEKILVVDDDVDSLKLIGLMLQRNGYEVIAANSGGQALTKADGMNPDLIILDIMMPDMNGYDVCRRLRANPKTQTIPIIMFTAKTLIDDKVAGFEAGADDYLTKPTHPQELASRVKAVLARSADRRTQTTSSGGLTIGVLGAKGGVGTTTIATNIAAALHQSGGEPVLADFRPGSGSLGLFLGIHQARAMARLLGKPASEINVTTVEQELVVHQTGLRMLLSSTRPKESQIHYTSETAAAIIEAMREIGQPAICDLGNGFSPMVNRLQSLMNTLLLVVEPNAACLTMAREIMQEIGGTGDQGRLQVVVMNRTQSSMQTSWNEIEHMLDQDIKGIVSAAPELAFQAIEAGMPMVLMQPNGMAPSQIIKIAESLQQPTGQ